MQKVIIIGPNSYLATGLNRYLTDKNLQYLQFYNWHENLDLLSGADCIINFSIAPEFSTNILNDDEIIDIQIAKAIQKYNIQYIFISSRKVYGSKNDVKIYREKDELIGTDIYAQNKIKTEQKLTEIMGNNLTILRVSNVVGEPIYRQHYKTFMGWICENIIQNGKLIVTQNENAVKDFITKKFFHQNLSAIISQRLTGIYNLSSGFGTTVKDILCGYAGNENVIFAGSKEKIHDQFILNNSKLSTQTGICLSPDSLHNYLHICHKELITMSQKCKSTR